MGVLGLAQKFKLQKILKKIFLVNFSISQLIVKLEEILVQIFLNLNIFLLKRHHSNILDLLFSLNIFLKSLDLPISKFRPKNTLNKLKSFNNLLKTYNFNIVRLDNLLKELTINTKEKNTTLKFSSRYTFQFTNKRIILNKHIKDLTSQF